jgi:hypothetical protein
MARGRANLPHDEDGGPEGTLMWTDDRDGVDVQQWTKLAEHVIGQAPVTPTVSGRKAVKKAMRSRPDDHPPHNSDG